MIRIHELKINVCESRDTIPERLVQKIGMKGLSLGSYAIVKESVDARDKNDLKRVYSVDFEPAIRGCSASEAEELVLRKSRKLKLEKSPSMEYRFVETGSEPMRFRPVITGFGPCGMFAALILAEMGYRPVVIERGKQISERIRDVDSFWKDRILKEESNVQFGEGGAGLFSDGKLTTQIKDYRVRKVLEEFVEAGGDPELLYQQKPHIGTDILRGIVFRIREKIISLGGEIHFESKLTGIEMKNGEPKLAAVLVDHDKKIETEHLVLAIGHSARDTFRMLNRLGLAMAQKPFSIGVRMEHPQSMINEAQYGKKWTEHGLGAADYKLSYRCGNGRGVYTFCMCPGGYVIGAASSEGGVVTNGMSYQARASENANSALLVDVRTEDFMSCDPLAGIEFQEKYEKLAFEAGGRNYNAPAQRVEAFLGTSGNAQHGEQRALEPTYLPGLTWTSLSTCLPEFAVEAMKEAIPALAKKLKGFDRGDAVMTGVETRSSSPVRMIRDAGFMSSIRGIYPAGEGAGYAGGIVSAAVDGIRIAEAIARQYGSTI